MKVQPSLDSLTKAARIRKVELSPFVTRCLSSISMPSGTLAADIACGYGRHALRLAVLGYSTYCIDIDGEALNSIQMFAKRCSPPLSILPIRADLSNDILLLENSFGIVLATHYPGLNLPTRLIPLLKKGGYILLETYSGHGGNWHDLPAAGELKRSLLSRCHIIKYVERPVGPTRTEAVSVKALAQRN